MSHDNTIYKTKVAQTGTQVYEATVTVVSTETGEIVGSHTATGPSAKVAAQEAVSEAVNSRPIDRNLSDPEDPYGPHEVHNPMGEVELTAVDTPKQELSEKKKGSKTKLPHLSSKQGKRQIKAAAASELQPAEEEEDPPVFFVKGNPRNHAPWSTYFEDDTGTTIPMNDGRNGNSLVEPVPEYFKRSGDKVITAEVNNNAWIILGRDRNGIGESYTSTEKRDLSGFSDHMGAGAIDNAVSYTHLTLQTSDLV